MNKIPPRQTVSSPRVIDEFFREEIDLGITMAADPDNAGLSELAIRITTMNSPWFSRTCRMCKDKFREGDLVRICPKCRGFYHDDHQYELYCWQKHLEKSEKCRCGWRSSDKITETSAATGELLRTCPPESIVRQFISGVETVWRPFGEQQVLKIPSGSALIGRKCPWCRFRVRTGDWVVKCPCGTECGTFFHQDVFRHLTCWNEWNGVEGNQYCPTTGAAYKRSGA